MSNQKNKTPHTPLILCILDGWGIYKDYNGNAITQAKTPNFDKLWKEFPHTQIKTHAEFVGLPKGVDGNSEAGHLNLGAGRIVKQDIVAINQAIQDGTFFKNPAFIASAKHVKKYNSQVHLMGLLSGWQSAHSDPKHLVALLKFYREQKIKKVFLHLFTDGRDSFQYGAKNFLKELKKELQPHEKIASISGRYYAMDRRKKWERVEKVYNLLTQGKADYLAQTPEEAIQQAYDRGETDEFIIPTAIVNDGKCDGDGKCVAGTPKTIIQENDSVIFFNLRSDRTRELSKAFVQKDFEHKARFGFKRKKFLQNLNFVSMTDFGPDLDSILSAFPSHDLKNTLPMVLKNLKQLYIAETEKYAHVTYFFNGGYADPVDAEERKIIESPDVPSYDMQPEMSCFQITDFILQSLKNNKYDVIVVNFANPDMVGHTGNLTAGIKACEAVDKCLGLIFNEIKKQKGVLLITADHGNIEEMINIKTGEVDTQHSSFPVPFILVDTQEQKKYNLKDDGILANAAPTILDLLNIEKPKEMNQNSLIIK